VVAYLKKKDQISNTDLSLLSNNPRIEISNLDPLFDKWLIENEALNGVLNQGLTKKKNIEFRHKIEAWKRRLNERKRIKKRTFE